MNKLPLHEIFLPEYLELIPSIFKLSAKLKSYFPNVDWDKIPTVEEIKIKGGKGTGKSVLGTTLIPLIMLLDDRTWFMAINGTQKGGREKLMGKFKESIRVLDNYIPGFYSQFEFRDTQNDPCIIRHNGKWEQKIDFVSIDELGTAGQKPSELQCFLMGVFIDEVSSEEDEINYIKLEKLERFKSTLKQTLGRDALIHFDSYMIRFEFQNPFNSEHSSLNDHNKYLPDDLEHMKKYGWNSTFIDGKYLATAATDINPYIFYSAKLMEDYERDKMVSEVLYNVKRFGINGTPIDLPFTNVWNQKIIPSQSKLNNPIKKEGILPIRFGMDVTGTDVKNPTAETSVVLSGLWKDGHSFTLIPFEEFTLSPKTLSYDINAWSNAILIWISDVLKRNGIVRKIQLRIDGAKDGGKWMAVMKQHQIALLQKYPNLMQLDIVLFPQSHKVKWDTATRMSQHIANIALDKMLIFREWTPGLFKQFPLQRAKNNNSREDGTKISPDDILNAFEYSCAEEIRDLAKMDRNTV